MHRPLASARLEVDGRLSAKEVHEALPPIGPNCSPAPTVSPPSKQLDGP